MILPLVVGQMSVNCYVVYDDTSGKAVIIDPGDDAEYIAQKLNEKRVVPEGIVATHGHFDHILAGFELQRIYNIPFRIHASDIFLVKRMNASVEHFLGFDTHIPPPTVNSTFDDNEEISIGAVSMRVLATPGHTPGSVSFYLANTNECIVGDTIFVNGALGRTDFSYSSEPDLSESIQKLLSLPPNTTLYPGHGQVTTVENEVQFHRRGV